MCKKNEHKGRCKNYRHASQSEKRWEEEVKMIENPHQSERNMQWNRIKKLTNYEKKPATTKQEWIL